MPEEPIHRMDDLLKSYARKRRDEAGPPMELPPAMRSRLQAEVRRAFGEDSAEAPSIFAEIENFWPRLLMGGAGVALLLIAAGLWLHFYREDKAAVAGLQERDLFLFANNAPETTGAAGGLGGGGQIDALPANVRDFVLDDTTGSASTVIAAGRSAQPGDLLAGAGAIPALAPALEPAASAAEAAAPGIVQSPPVATRPALGAASPQPERAQLAERIEVAGGLPTRFTEEMVSNTARYQYGIPPRPEIDDRTLGRRPQESLVDTGFSLGSSIKLDLGRSADPVVFMAGRDSSSAEEEIVATSPAPDESLAALKVSSTVEERVQEPPPNASAPAQLAAAAGPTPSLGIPEGRRLYFQQVAPGTRYRRNLNSPPLPKVLTTFEVHLAGNAVRIVDEDGSVYEGSIQVTPGEQRGVSSGGAGGALPFQVQGTNKTLDDLVVFTGQFDSAATVVAKGATAAQPATFKGDAYSQPEGTSLAREQRVGAAGSSSVMTGAPAPARIHGNASVGGKSEFRIEARQVAR